MYTTTSEVPQGYVSPKDWEVLTDSEKIERLRDVIKNLQFTINSISQQFSNLNDAFEKHNHDGRGIKVPYNRYSKNGGCLIGAETSSKYF